MNTTVLNVVYGVLVAALVAIACLIGAGVIAPEIILLIVVAVAAVGAMLMVDFGFVKHGRSTGRFTGGMPRNLAVA